MSTDSSWLSKQGAGKLADFIMFTQRSFLLDLSRELNASQVSYAQFFLLGYLDKEELLSMTDIAQKMGHSTDAATGMVDRLEKLGYVERMHASDDRRKVMVKISKAGQSMVKKIRAVIEDGLMKSRGAEGETEGGKDELQDLLSALEVA